MINTMSDFIIYKEEDNKIYECVVNDNGEIVSKKFRPDKVSPFNKEFRSISKVLKEFEEEKRRKLLEQMKQSREKRISIRGTIIQMMNENYSSKEIIAKIKEMIEEGYFLTPKLGIEKYVEYIIKTL